MVSEIHVDLNFITLERPHAFQVVCSLKQRQTNIDQDYIREKFG